MITAKTVSQYIGEDKVTIYSTVEYSNGKVIGPFPSVSKESFIQAVRDQIAQYEKLEAVVILPPDSVIDVAPPVVVVPVETKEEAEYRVFNQEVNKYLHLKAVLNLGVVDAQVLDDQRVVIQGLWKIDYLLKLGLVF